MVLLHFHDPRASPPPEFGALPRGAWWRTSSDLCQRFTRGEWGSCSREAVGCPASRGHAHSAPRAFRVQRGPLQAARKDACMGGSEQATHPRLCGTFRPTPSAPACEDTLAALQQRHPSPCSPSLHGSTTDSPPHLYLSLHPGDALKGAIRTALEGTAGGADGLDVGLASGCLRSRTTPPWRPLPASWATSSGALCPAAAAVCLGRSTLIRSVQG